MTGRILFYFLGGKYVYVHQVVIKTKIICLLTKTPNILDFNCHQRIKDNKIMKLINLAEECIY